MRNMSSLQDYFRDWCTGLKESFINLCNKYHLKLKRVSKTKALNMNIAAKKLQFLTRQCFTHIFNLVAQMILTVSTVSGWKPKTGVSSSV